LTSRIPSERIASGQDVLTAARDELDSLGKKVRQLEGAMHEMDTALEEHRVDFERLRELAKWRVAASRAQQRTDLATAPSFRPFQVAVDEAAGFAADIESLDGLLREAQAEHSVNRTAQVNRYLGSCLGEITTESNDLDVRVHVRRTPKGLTYELDDKSGERAMATQNQASINAVSLALLFAQATVRARDNLPAWVMLDEPTQSFDDEHQRGLARAIARVARFCPVIVTTTRGPLAEFFRQFASVPHRVFLLAPWDAAQGVRIAREKDR
jgi:DNA repair exonuclease SbcCD ATPase subunit